METNVFQNQERLAALAHVAAYDAEKLARLYGSSSRQFRRVFQATRGCSPREYLNDLRIAEAIKRLLAGTQPKRVAYDLGFNQPPSFYRWFKRSTGVAPLEYMARVEARGLRDFCP